MRINTYINWDMPDILEGLFYDMWHNYQYSIVTFTDNIEGELLWYGKEITSMSLKRTLPFHRDHFMLKENRCVFFTKFQKIIEHLSQFDFSIGTRLHGAVASILAGVPSMLIVYGSRPLEVAQYAHIPFIKYDEVKKYTVEELYEKALLGMEEYYRFYNANIANYVDFSRKNNLPINYRYLTQD